MLGLAGLTRAATTVNLGTADNFAILAGSAITGPGVITGDLGLTPGTSVTGFPPGTVSGVQHIADVTAVQAQNDLTTAYNNALGQASISTVATELGGTTKTAGVYDSAAGTFGITGTLTLNAQNNPNAVFIFKAASTLITAGSSNIVLINGAQACNVFWQVGSSATLGTNSTFKGNILAMTSITLTTNASVQGRLLARNGAITLDNNTVTKAVCISSSAAASLHLVKTVVNGTGGTAVSSDFTMHIKASGTDVVGSPTIGTGIPGTYYTLNAGNYVVSEDIDASYTQSFGGACDSNGNVTLSAGDDKTCVVT
ncbi:MAG: ice-binding family protein, partial [Candidatus Gracilibacteria bacterium]|nr:ice-binding family protein [Candidatus Gracilibacteria bacterium]